MAEKWGQVKAVYGEKERKFYVDPMMANEFIFSIVNFFLFYSSGKEFKSKQSRTTK